MAVLVAGLLRPALLSAADRESPLPAWLSEKTQLVVWLPDMPGFLAAGTAGPFGRFWNDPEVRRFLAPLRESLQIDHWEELVQNATGYTLTEILAQFTGQAALVLPDLTALGDSGERAAERTPWEYGDDPYGQPGGDTYGEGGGQRAGRDGAEPADQEATLEPLAFLADVGTETEMLESLLALDLKEQQESADPGEQLRMVEEEFDGETLHVLQRVSRRSTSEEEAWAIVDGVAVMAQPKSYLQELIARLKQAPGPGSLAETEHYQSMLQTAGRFDLLAYLNVTSLYPALKESIVDEFAPRESEPAGPAQEQLLNALALEAVQSVFWTCRQSVTETALDYGVITTEDRGVLELLACLPGPYPRPAFLPQDALGASVDLFSIKEAWAALRGLLAAIDAESSAALSLQLQQIAGNTGVDIEKDLLGSLGDMVFMVTSSEALSRNIWWATFGTFDQVIGVSLTDPATFERQLTTLLDSMAEGMQLFQAQDYLGTTIHSLRPELMGPSEEGGQQLSYAVAGNTLLVGMGTGEILKEVLARMRDPGASLWDRSDVTDILARLPQDASGMFFCDLGAYLNYVFDVMATMSEDDEFGDAPVDPRFKPDARKVADFFGPLVGTIQKDSRSILGQFRLLHPAP